MTETLKKIEESCLRSLKEGNVYAVFDVSDILNILVIAKLFVKELENT